MFLKRDAKFVTLGGLVFYGVRYGLEGEAGD